MGWGPNPQTLGSSPNGPLPKYLAVSIVGRIVPVPGSGPRFELQK